MLFVGHLQGMYSCNEKDNVSHKAKDNKSYTVKDLRQNPYFDSKSRNHGPKYDSSADYESQHWLPDNDPVCEDHNMMKVWSCVRKIISKLFPVQAASAFGWIIVKAAFICLLVFTMYLAMRLLSKSDEKTIVQKPIAMHIIEQQRPLAPPVQIVNVTTQKFCSTLSKNLYFFEQLGYMDPEHRVSKLMALNISSSDVHYVFTNSTHVPWLHICALESVLRSVTGNYRINVFVVYGLQFEQSLLEKQYPVSR